MKNLNKKRVLIFILLMLLMVIFFGIYLYNKPHQDINKVAVFEEIPLNDLLNQFIKDPVKANAKYLSADGNSKVIIVSGVLSSVSINQKNQMVVLLKNKEAHMGASCTLIEGELIDSNRWRPGDTVRVRGRIVAGNEYDTNLDLYNNAILIQCRILK